MRASIRMTATKKKSVLASAIAALLFPLSVFASSTTLTYTGGDQVVVIPAGVTSIHVELKGAGGGGWSGVTAGGAGGYASGDIAVTPGSTLKVIVGQGGSIEGQSSYGGGGWPLLLSGGMIAGSGGGRSAICASSGGATGLCANAANELITAGGGGGGYDQRVTVPGAGYWGAGGAGGGTNGVTGVGGSPYATEYDGAGGTQTGPGCYNYKPSGTAFGCGSQFQGGWQASDGTRSGFGSGGGGWYGGGIGMGAGGGSSHCASSVDGCTLTTGGGAAQNQNGSVTITWDECTISYGAGSATATGPGTCIFTVPSGVTSVHAELKGAGGGGRKNLNGTNRGGGGKGGATSGDVAVTAGSQLTVVVGEGGTLFGNRTAGGGGAAGYCTNTSAYGGGSGGGRSAIQRNDTDLMTAGGGGGAATGEVGSAAGGPGGGSTGGASGTQYQGRDGAVGNSSGPCAGGGGGGGWYGGSGGANGFGGGGGGSGYCGTSTNCTTTAGAGGAGATAASGENGSVTITWTPGFATCAVTLTPGTVNKGSGSTLSWSSQNADTSVYIDNAGYVSTEDNGHPSSGSFSVPSDTTTNYRCYAQGSGGTDGWHDGVLTVLQPCTFNGNTVTNGSSVTAYQSDSVPYGSSCVSQTRTCTDGSLSGTYAYASCQVSHQSCTLSGVTVEHGDSHTFYSSQTAPPGGLCSAVSQSRTCTDGTLSGFASYQYASCTCAPLSYCAGAVIHTVDGQCADTPHPACVSPQFCSPGVDHCLNPDPVFNAGENTTGHLEAKPQIVPKGETTRLHWDVSNVQSCTVTGTNGDGTGLNGTGTWYTMAGEQTSSPITSQVIYTLTCQALEGATPSSLSEQVTVTNVPVFQEL
jgi:hypothetical protein